MKVFIHECYCKLCEGTQIKSGKKLNFKTHAFILVKWTEVIRNVREQAHRRNKSDSAPVSIKEWHTVPEDSGWQCGSSAEEADNPEGSETLQHWLKNFF